MDISKLTTEELQALLKRIPEEIERRKQMERSKLLSDIEQIASQSGYSLRELIGKTPRSGKGNRPQTPVKYRHPEQTALTWTGRGRRPRWIIKWLDEGKSLDKLAV